MAPGAGRTTPDWLEFLPNPLNAHGPRLASRVAQSDLSPMQEHLENLRARAIFYFELGRDLKNARYIDSDTLFHDARSMCFILAAVFTLGGVLAFLVTRKPPAA